MDSHINIIMPIYGHHNIICHSVTIINGIYIAFLVFQDPPGRFLNFKNGEAC